MRAAAALVRLACGAVALWGIAPAVRAQETGTAPLLHAMFQDHAVLQRDAPIRVWGQAAPGERVEVSFAGRTARARAAADGRWEARLPAQAAGGPYTLTVEAGDAVRTVRDVLVGDVWLCAGQSNMELQVWRSLDARAEIAGAARDTIRLFAVPQAGAATPQTRFQGDARWRTATPDSVRDFSAACFYFARELQKTVDVPMGLIGAAWGGSRIEAWTSGEALRRTGRFDAALDVLSLYARDAPAAMARWGALWERWWTTREGAVAGDEPWRPAYVPDAAWRDAPAALGAWEQWGVPALAAFDGMVWYRTQVALTAAQVTQDAVLELGPADEMDMTWVNGVAVGSTYGAGSRREYALPRGLLKEGINTVVVNVLDTYRDGGLSGPASAHAVRFGDGSRVVLDAAWKYRQVPGSDGPPRAPWQSAAGLSTLHNGMIAPIGPYGLRGALWYQGESNTSDGAQYADLLRTLRADWRARFGDGLPMLVVQLAGYGMPVSAPQESGWAALRESQRQVVAEDPRSGLAVAIDIGDHYDLHPPNKQEVGRRLARAARRVVYGEEALPPSGPVPRGARRAGDAVAVAFDGITGTLVAYGADGPIGFELCGAQPGSCRYAGATIDGDTVTLRAPAVREATRVRYCWADGPVCTLYDGAGLPAGPFELPLSPSGPAR